MFGKVERVERERERDDYNYSFTQIVNDFIIFLCKWKKLAMFFSKFNPP